MRTYVPGLVKIARGLCRFTDRYNNKIRPWLVANKPNAVAAYDALRIACDAFDALFPDNPPPLDK